MPLPTWDVHLRFTGLTDELTPEQTAHLTAALDRFDHDPTTGQLDVWGTVRAAGWPDAGTLALASAMTEMTRVDVYGAELAGISVEVTPG